MKVITAMFLSGLLMLVAVPVLRADSGNWDTFLTFSAPVEVPGMALPPGKYEFRLMDSGAPAWIVEILNSKGQYLEAVEGTPVYRTDITDKTVVKLEKRNPGSPEAIESWFYPGQNYGVEFTYSNAKPLKTVRPGK
jgi:hypothetical protein